MPKVDISKINVKDVNDTDSAYLVMDAYRQDPDAFEKRCKDEDVDSKEVLKQALDLAANDPNASVKTVIKYDSERLNKYDTNILAWTNYYNDRLGGDLDPNLVKAIMYRESKMRNISQRNKKGQIVENGGRGLMQVEDNPKGVRKTLLNLGVKMNDMFNIDQNISAGIAVLYYRYGIFKYGHETKEYKLWQHIRDNIDNACISHGNLDINWLYAVAAYNGNRESINGEPRYVWGTRQILSLMLKGNFSDEKGKSTTVWK